MITSSLETPVPNICPAQVGLISRKGGDKVVWRGIKLPPVDYAVAFEIDRGDKLLNPWYRSIMTCITVCLRRSPTLNV